MSQYEIPSCIDELFLNGGANYSIVNYTINDMDNVQSMEYFLNLLDIGEENIDVDNGTEVILSHPDFDFKMRVESGGLGDPHSHSFDVTLYDGVKNEN